VLSAPDAAVGGIDLEQLDAGAGGHPGEPFAEHGGGYTGHGAAEAFPAGAATHGFSPGHPGVGEVEVFDRDRMNAVPARVAD
jgi:hypothetical protein